MAKRHGHMLCGLLLLVSSGCSDSPPAAPAVPSVDAPADAGVDAPSAAGAVRSLIACPQEGVRSVDVPAVYTRPEGEKLAVSYRVFPARKSDAPTVIVVPGGPGGDIMRQAPTDAFALGAVPAGEVNVIYTDARGSGCNSYPALTSDSHQVFTIESTARDLLAIVRKEALGSYVLYGASFGTAQVTVAASLAEREGVPRPARIVLEGTVGKAFSSFAEYFGAFEREWVRVKPLLPQVWTTAFEAEPPPKTLFWSREQWGAFIAAQLILGDIPRQQHILSYWLNGLSRQDPAAQRYVAAFMDGVSKGTPSELFRTIACRELWGAWQSGRELRDGLLHSTGADLCAGESFVAPYDSARYPLTVPISYFQGPYDPTTTVALAKYHLDAHRSSARQFVQVPDASHAPLTLGLAGRGCASAVWTALLRAPDSLATALGTCTQGAETPVELQSLPPE